MQIYIVLWLCRTFFAVLVACLAFQQQWLSYKYVFLTTTGVPFSVVIPLLLRQLMYCFVAICVQHWIRVITFYGVQFFAAMLSRNEFKSFHNKRTVYGSTSDSLCCCEYIDRKGKNNHLLACCCDCEALDSVCDQYERSRVLLNKNIQ